MRERNSQSDRLKAIKRVHQHLSRANIGTHTMLVDETAIL